MATTQTKHTLSQSAWTEVADGATDTYVTLQNNTSKGVALVRLAAAGGGAPDGSENVVKPGEAGVFNNVTTKVFARMAEHPDADFVAMDVVVAKT